MDRESTVLFSNSKLRGMKGLDGMRSSEKSFVGLTSAVGFPLKPGFPLKQVYVITQWFLGQIGSNVGQIFYMYGTFTR